MQDEAKKEIAIVWFKRDLRIQDHAPLFAASRLGIPVVPLYVVEVDYWQQPYASMKQWKFIHDCLVDLNNALKGLGQPLVVRTGEIIAVLNTIQSNYRIKEIICHEETGTDWTYQRDIAVRKWSSANGVKLSEYPTNGVVRRLPNRDAWSKLRNERMRTSIVPTPEKIIGIEAINPGHLPTKEDSIFQQDNAKPQAGGRKEGIAILDSFLEERGKSYLYYISAPGKSATHCSRLSPHLTWGTLSMKEVVHALEKLKQHNAYSKHYSAFSSRLSWRCHFVQKLEDQPSIEFKCMHPGFETMRQECSYAWLNAWKRGKTGYPIIDACMRQLAHDGWITFRMRAMLASFAGYQLWLDWREYGPYLGSLFTDFEPGIHFSQLQMQSGVTGINAVRMYNPMKQSLDHDPEGIYIKKWVPELKKVPKAFIHEPWKMNIEIQKDAHCILDQNYPAPIVDHTTSVQRARKEISAIRHEIGFKDTAKKVYNKLGSRKRIAKKPPKKDNNQLSFDI